MREGERGLTARPTTDVFSQWGASKGFTLYITDNKASPYGSPEPSLGGTTAGTLGSRIEMQIVFIRQSTDED